MDNNHVLLEVSALTLFFQLQSEKGSTLIELDLENRSFQTADVQNLNPLTKEYVQLANGITTKLLFDVCNNLAKKQLGRVFVVTTERCILLEVQQTDTLPVFENRLLSSVSITF